MIEPALMMPTVQIQFAYEVKNQLTIVTHLLVALVVEETVAVEGEAVYPDLVATAAHSQRSTVLNWSVYSKPFRVHGPRSSPTWKPEHCF